MALSPEEIENRKFSRSVRGYDRTEVDRFVRLVSTSTRELYETIDGLSTDRSDTTSPPSGDAQSAPDEPLSEDSQSGESQSGESLSGDSAWAASASTDDEQVLEMAIIDRYGALGDRIAELLRSADDSAAQLREAAEADAVRLRAEAEEEASRIRAEAEEQSQQLRSAAEEQSSHLLSEARTIRAEADAHLAEAQSSAETLRAEADAAADVARGRGEEEAEQARAQAVADGLATIADHETEVVERLRVATEDRDQARAELNDVRSQVSGLLEQARAQSEFIRQEAEEIIRTKIRANMESAQARIEILRNTEVASRERIVLAQRELDTALSRLDSEDVPSLGPGLEAEVLDEAELRGAELGHGTLGDTDAADAGSAIVDVVESDSDSDSDAERSAAAVRDPLGDLLEPDSAESVVVETVVETIVIESVMVEIVDTAGDEPVVGEEVAAPFLPGSFVTTRSDSGDDQDEREEHDVHEEEDALARLVREAMQEAVDSARKHE